MVKMLKNKMGGHALPICLGGVRGRRVGLKIQKRWFNSIPKHQRILYYVGSWYSGRALVSKTRESCSIRLDPANMLCYFSGRRLPLQGRGRWFESTTEYHLNNGVKRIRLWNAVGRHHSDIDHSYNSCNPFPIVYVLLVQRKEQRSSKP